MQVKCNLSEVLSRQGKTMYWLEKESGVSRPTIIKYAQNNSMRYDYLVLYKMAKALDVKIKDIVFVDESLPDLVAKPTLF